MELLRVLVRSSKPMIAVIVRQGGNWVQSGPDVKEFQSALLDCCRGRQHGELVIAQAHLTLGQRRQVRQQHLEAVHRQAVGGGSRECLALGFLRSLRRTYDAYTASLGPCRA